MKHIVIIGGGFCGTITAVNLLREAKAPLKITIINSGESFIRGIAYNTYSSKHLLNVATGNMSAFPDDKTHFTNWVHGLEKYIEYKNDLLEKTFLPRNLYGAYLSHIWDTTLSQKREDIEITIINDSVIDIEFTENNLVKIILENDSPILASHVVLATGNSLPRNTPITNMAYYSSPTYYRNPWTIDSVSNLKPDGDVLIIGNGLTMVDTVIGLMEHGFKNKIYSISTNGFGILPHRHSGVVYTGLIKELPIKFDLHSLVRLVHKHIKKVRKLGVSAESVIDSLRPYSQKIWQAFSLEEKKQFLSKHRHRWGFARHRLPTFVFDAIEQHRISGSLKIYKGKLIDIAQQENEIIVKFRNTKNSCDETLSVQRIINCTGPETSIYKTENPLLHKLAEKGIISSDPLELGINVDISTFGIVNAKGEKNPSLFTLGTNLKGLLWETTAVPELRVQCQELAIELLKAGEIDK